jgi:hypothetical protein
LTGGLFQPNLLRLQDTDTGELLTVFHTAKQRKQTGAAKAPKTIAAQGDVEGWLPATDPGAWTRLSVEEEQSR